MRIRLSEGAVFGLVLLSLVSCATVERVENPASFTSAPLFGMVYDADGSPVQGVKIALDGSSCAVSDVNGRFVVPEVRKGEHTFSGEIRGYEPVSMTFMFLNRSQVLYLRISSFGQLLSRAEAALETGDLKTADDALVRAGQIDSGSSPVLSYLLAVLYWKKGAADEAVRILEALMTSGYDGQEVREFLGKIRAPP